MNFLQLIMKTDLDGMLFETINFNSNSNENT